MEMALMLDEHLQDKYNQLKYHQARTEYFLVLILAYLWNRNINTDSISSKDKLEISNKISSKNFTIGTLIKVIESLDVENEIVYDVDVKTLFDTYRETRNEEIGHGFSFSDASDELINAFIKMHQSFSSLNTFLFKNNFDIILVIQEDSHSYKGINLKSDGSLEIWSCRKSANIALNINCTYLQYSHCGIFEYFRLSPFIGVEREGGTNINYYIFNKINNIYTGCVTYNYLSKTGKKTDIAWVELANLDIITDGQVKVSKNGTTINVFEPNYKRFIDVGATKDIVNEFLTKNKSNVCANLWGHGGVGKTATIQKVCEELISTKNKHFKYILFLSAKNTLFNTETGHTEEISEDYRVDDYESLLKGINAIVFREMDNNIGEIENKIKEFNEGKILLIVDDYESFQNIEKEKVIKFIGTLNIEYHKVIITTRSTVEIEGSKPVPISELDISNTILFFRELLSKDNNIPDSKKNKINKSLETQINKQKLLTITDGRPLFITYLANILTRIEFEEALEQDIKSSKAAINFLFGKLFTYLTDKAKLLFLAIGQMDKSEDLTYSLSHVRFVSKLDTDEDMEMFNDGINELEKYKIVKLDDSKLLFRLWAEELLGPMNESFQSYDDNNFKSVVIQRAKLIKQNKKAETIQEILFHEAEKLRIDGNKKEATVESAYRRVINSNETSRELKLQAINKLANYFITEGNRGKAIKVYSDFELEFANDPDYVKKFAYICYGSKERNHRNKSIQVLLDFINYKHNRNALPDGLKLELYGIIVMRKTTFAHENIERERNKLLIRIISESDFDKRILEFSNLLRSILNHEGYLLFEGIKKVNTNNLSKNEKHYIFNGLYHFVEVCIKLQKFEKANDVCSYIFENAPFHFHKLFKYYLKRIPSGKHLNFSKEITSPIDAEHETTEKIYSCEVEEIRDKVVFVNVLDSNDKGSVYINEMSSKFVSHPSIIFSNKQKVDLIRIGNDQFRNISLSLKKMEEKLYEGQVVKCQVLQVFEKKVLVKILKQSLLGEIYIKYASNRFLKSMSDILSVGDFKYAEVISVNRQFGIGLSLIDVPQGDDEYISELGLKIKKALFNE